MWNGIPEREINDEKQVLKLENLNRNCQQPHMFTVNNVYNNENINRKCSVLNYFMSHGEFHITIRIETQQ